MPRISCAVAAAPAMMAMPIKAAKPRAEQAHRHPFPDPDITDERGDERQHRIHNHDIGNCRQVQREDVGDRRQNRDGDRHDTSRSHSSHGFCQIGPVFVSCKPRQRQEGEKGSPANQCPRFKIGHPDEWAGRAPKNCRQGDEQNPMGPARHCILRCCAGCPGPLCSGNQSKPSQWRPEFGLLSLSVATRAPAARGSVGKGKCAVAHDALRSGA